MEYLLRYEVWLIGALVLIAIDVLIGLDFILFAFGLGAGVVGLSLLFNDTLPLPYTENWESMVTFFAVVSLLILVPLRRFARRPAPGQIQDDINKY
jgi:Membrane protein implicated in regulation of membrane protease activity